MDSLSKEAPAEGLSVASPTWFASSGGAGHLRQTSGLRGEMEKLPLGLCCALPSPPGLYIAQTNT